ncbi:uncharacterized protein TNCV_3339651 [Trichonephila clavipes]|nr:uncharacterized protein TNCV_3339651 [Trichonephila clavipes]
MPYLRRKTKRNITRYLKKKVMFPLVEPLNIVRVIRYHTDKLVESAGDTETGRNHIGMQGLKDPCELSDEAHFWLNGYVNKQNCRIWSEANPQVYVETPLHPETLAVWCALWAGGIIGPYFFKYDEGHNVTVNGDRYRAMSTNFFIPELDNHDVQELCFQQDGTTCHTARATIDLLKDTFDKPQTLDHLEDNIRRVIADIWPQMLEKVIENWTSRLDYIRASRGSPMPEIIFKISIRLSDFSGIRNPNVLESKISLFTTSVRSAHLQASKPIENKQQSFTPNHIQDLIYLENKAKRKYNQTPKPIHKAN